MTEKKTRNIANQMPEQNGVRMPRNGTLSAKVWNMANSLSQALTKKAVKTWEKNNGKVADEKIMRKLFVVAPVKPILEKLSGEIVDTNIRTQYARWRKYYGITGRHQETKTKKIL